MINVSDQLLKESKENQDYYVTANVTLADGTNLPLKKKTLPGWKRNCGLSRQQQFPYRCGN